MTIPINDAIKAVKLHIAMCDAVHPRLWSNAVERIRTTEESDFAAAARAGFKAAVESKSYDKWGNRRGFDEAEAVQWAEIVIASVQGREAPLSPMLREQVNAARAALRWRERLAAALARIVELEQSARAYEHEVMTGRNEQHDRLVAERDRLKERIAELEAQAIPERLKVMCKCGDEIGPESLVSLCAPCADTIEAERDAAIKRADEAEGALRELAANVRGECPSLLNEDSGGDWKLSMRIDAILEARHE